MPPRTKAKVEPKSVGLGAAEVAKGKPAVRRCEAFLDDPIAAALEVRVARADKLLALDKKVDACVKALKAAGLTSAYLKPFVVARINPIRFAKRGKSFDFDETIDKMIAKAEAFDASSVKASDLTAGAAAYGAE
jgi:ParB family transcriptional regulator, chromosome partitioning protein